jgi:ABC-type ATPase involved in cell division
VLIASHDLSLIKRMGYRTLSLSQGEMVDNHG